MYMKMLLRYLSIAVLLLQGVSESKVLDTLVVDGLLNPSRESIVRTHAGLRQGREFDPAHLQQAVKRLYYLGLFHAVDFYVTDETDSTVSLLLRLDEYPVLETVEFKGNRKLKDGDLEEELTIKEGRVLSDAEMERTIRAIEDAYAEKGYLLAEIEVDTSATKVPGNVNVSLRIKEGVKVRVEEISFVGNEEVPERKLKRKFKTKERKFFWGGDFGEEEYRLHLDSLVMFYNDEGFLDAEVVDDSLWYSEDNKSIFIEIEVSEGNKFYVGDFYFKGNKVVPTEALHRQIALKRGKEFSKSKFELTKASVGNRYREDGYLWVQVRDEQAYREDTIDVTFDIVEGIPAIVNEIDITGNSKTRERVIRREIRLMPGQKYKQSLMARSVREIYQLNYFSNAVPDMRPNEDGTVDFVFDVAEKEGIGRLQVGAAYSQVQKFVGTFEVSIPNFRGAGQKLDLGLEYGKLRQSIQLGFSEPWAFGTPTRLSGNMFWRRYVYENRGSEPDDIIRSGGFTGTVGRRLKWPDDYFSASMSYRFSLEEEYGQGKSFYRSNRLDVLRKGLLSRVGFTLRRDDTDMPLFPTSGSIVSVRPEIAGLGGDYRYIKGIFETENYFPVFWKFVLGMRMKFGLIGPPGTGPIAISRWDLFSGGGVYGVDAVVRGYDEFSLGGRYNYEQEDGISMLSLSSELRFPILEQQLYLAFFGDMGNTWSDMSRVDPTDMYKGIGAGVRLNIPMLGLLGFDFGWGLDDPDRDGHFSNRFQAKLKPHFIMNQGF